MEPLEQDDNFGQVASAAAESGRYAMSYPEICSAFLSALSKAIKSAGIYSVSHPMVMGSLEKAFGLLNSVLAAGRETRLTVSFAHDTWMFNDAAVPSITPESQQLGNFFRAHAVQGVTFLAGVRSFEVGALCEYMATSPRNQPPGYFKDFLKYRGVTGVIPETVRYVKDPGYAPRAAARPAVAVKPRSAAIASAPEAAPRPAAVSPVPAAEPRVEDFEFSEAMFADIQASAAPPPVRAVPKPAPGPEAEPAVKAPERRAEPRPSAGKSEAGIEDRGPGSGPGKGAGEGSGGILGGMSLGSLLTKLVESAVTDPKERVHVYEDALKMLRETLAQQVAATTKGLAEEKDRILNTRNRTEQVLSQVAEGKVIVDKDGKILMMNPAAEQISGKRFAEVAGRHVSEHLRSGEHILTMSKDMDLSSGMQLSGEVSVSGDQSVADAMRRSMALLEDDEGRVVGAYATLPDITKFKESQRLQEEFLSKITHDLQSPLSSISSALEMLTDTAGAKLDTDESKFLAISLRNSRRLSEMIRGILDFSKLQSGKMTVHPEPVSVGAILKEAGEGLLPWAKTKGLSLVVRPPAPDVMAMADHSRAVQILTNLISNAIKSTPKGGTIVVAASRTANPDPGVVIGVRDTGLGISKEDMKKLFNKFVQLEGAGPREGVGLGLSIVNELVKLHKGKIWADSEPGKGSTFYFTLPLAGRLP